MHHGGMSYHATAPSTQRLPGQIDSCLDADQSALDMIAETA
jgi:hypothetical protein